MQVLPEDHLVAVAARPVVEHRQAADIALPKAEAGRPVEGQEHIADRMGLVAAAAALAAAGSAALRWLLPTVQQGPDRLVAGLEARLMELVA